MDDAVHTLTPEERAARLIGTYPTVEYPFKSVKIAPDMLIAHVANLIRDAVEEAGQPTPPTWDLSGLDPKERAEIEHAISMAAAGKVRIVSFNIEPKAPASDGGGSTDEQFPGSDQAGGSGLEQLAEDQASSPEQPAAT